MNPRNAVHVRWMIRRDTAEVLDAERHAVDPLDEAGLLAMLRGKNVIGLVAECGDRVVGHLVYALHRHHVEVVRLAVHPAWRRRGVASALLRKIQARLDGARRRSALFCVPEEADALHLTLRAHGWLAVKVCRGWPAPGRDSYCFELDHDPDPRPPVAAHAAAEFPHPDDED